MVSHFACKTPNEIWNTLDGLFGKQDEMRGPFARSRTKLLGSKFKSLLRELTDCGIDKSKQEKQMVLAIMEKLGPKFSLFVSTFHSIRFTARATWIIPSLRL
jgi:hypothetical protein